MTNILSEHFDESAFDARLTWFNPPERFEIAHGWLKVYPEAKTDFWQKTHYGFAADNGHFLALEVEGDFILSTQVRFHPAHQYDQAGLMVRLSPDCWVKTSVEYEPGEASKLGAVVTNHGFSDWSSQDFTAKRSEIEFRLTLTGEDLLVEASEDGRTWKQLRVAHLDNPQHAPLQVGLYACSPTEAGFLAEFGYLRISRPVRADAPVSLGEVTEENLRAIIKLSDTLSDNQRRMVAQNAVSIAQAHFSQHAWWRGIFAGEDPVGFVMVYIGPDPDAQPDAIVYFLWRFMIGAPYQKLGFGRKALELVMEMAREQGAHELLLSCGEGEGSPEGFYRRLGFERTGKVMGSEIVMRIGL